MWNQVLEFTYPPGSYNIPIANWETKATLDLKNLPSSLSVCSSYFLKSWIADVFTGVTFFTILDEEGEHWGELSLHAGSSNALETETLLVAKIGLKDDQVQIYATGKLPMVFPQSWVRGCMTLDTATLSCKKRKIKHQQKFLPKKLAQKTRDLRHFQIRDKTA